MIKNDLILFLIKIINNIKDLQKQMKFDPNYS